MIVKTVGKLSVYLAKFSADLPVRCVGYAGPGCDTCGYGTTEEQELDVIDLETRLVFEGV